MAPIRQTNFAAGELAKEYWGRTDMDRYQSGLRRMLNFFSSQHGAAVSRPGTQYLGTTKQSGVLGFDGVRLIPFVYSDTDALLLEFGHHYVRFWVDGVLVTGGTRWRLSYITPVTGAFTVGQVVTGATSGATGTIIADDEDGSLMLTNVVGIFVDAETLTDPLGGSAGAYGTAVVLGDPYELITPYTTSEVAALQYVQSGDVLTLTHPLHTPADLTRISNNAWTLAHVSFTRPVGYAEHKAYLLDPLPAATADEPARPWTWLLTAVFRDDKGRYVESAPMVVSDLNTPVNYPGAATGTVPGTAAVYQDLPVTLYAPSPTTPAGWKLVSSRVYRGRGSSFGWIGDLDPDAGETFIDVGTAPDYTDPPPRGQNPFAVYDASDVLLRTESPAAVAYFQNRLVFGGTDDRPSRLFFSKTGDFHNFDESMTPPPLADDALVFELASRRLERICSMMGANALIVFTTGSVWTMTGGQGQPLTPDSVEARVVEEIGSSRLRPLSVEGSALYTRTKGRGARALVPAGDANPTYQGVDVSLLAQHLFASETIVDWCYAEDPWGLVWAVRSDGILLSFTFNKQSEVWGWARHETQGEVKSICAIPATTEDAVYLAVERDGGTYVEKMFSRVLQGDSSDRAPLDSSVHWTGSTASVTGLDHLEGQEVYVVATKDTPWTVLGPYTVTGGAVAPDPAPATGPLDVGLLFTPELETLDLATAQVRARQKTVTAMAFEVTASDGLKSGPDFDTLTEAEVVPGEEQTDGVDLVRANISGGWNSNGRAVLQQSLPIPVTVLGLTREVDVGGD